MGDLVIDDVGAIEPNTHAFVVKVWREDGRDAAHGTVWRGHITHVVSGQRRYVTSLSELECFIATYLVALGLRLPLRWRICQWVNRLREHP